MVKIYKAGNLFALMPLHPMVMEGMMFSGNIPVGLKQFDYLKSI